MEYTDLKETILETLNAQHVVDNHDFAAILANVLSKKAENQAPEWKLEIKRVKNGYILRGDFTGNGATTEHVISEDEYSENGELEAMTNLLYEVKEYFGVSYSKHAEKNIRIEIEESNK